MLRELLSTPVDWARGIPRGWRVALTGALLFAVAVGLGRAVTGGGLESAGPRETSTDPRLEAPAARGAQMLRQDGNAVLGVLRSNDGAAAAALSYTVQRNRLLTGSTSSAMAAEIGSKLALPGRDIGDRPASIPDRAAERDPTAMLATRQGTVGWLTVPIAHRVRAATSRRAVVRVLSAMFSVASDPARGPGAVGFALRDVTLDWADGAWRIRSVLDTQDQPTPAMVVATDSHRDAATLPTRDRVIRATQSDSTGLFDWLRDAETVLVGPRGMGPVAGQGLARLDANLTEALAVGYGRTPARGKRADIRTWSAGTPIAARRIECPASAANDLRCFEVLATATTFSGRGIAITNLQLAGIAVPERPESSGSVRFDINRDVQSRVLGGTLRIASAGLPERRTTGASWRRSAAPLGPVFPAVSR